MGVDHHTYITLGFSCRSTKITESVARALIAQAKAAGWCAQQPSFSDGTLVIYNACECVDLGSHRGEEVLVVDISGLSHPDLTADGNALRDLFVQADLEAIVSPLNHVSIHESD
jgi:hypothetical protein